MSAMSNLHADITDFEDRLRADAAHLLTAFRELKGKLLGETKTDAEQLAGDAETAVKPVLAEAEHDAAALGETAVTAATQAAAAGLSPQSASAAAPATEKPTA